MEEQHNTSIKPPPKEKEKKRERERQRENEREKINKHVGPANR
jgi:hypothetical protein